MINQSLIIQARQSNLATYLLNKGEPLKRVGKNYTHKQHDSLYIKDNMFVWYSQDKKGNSVDFLMIYYGMTFKQAVEALTGAELPTPNYTPQERTASPQRATDEKRVIAYLCKRRGLENRLIFALIKQGKLWQECQKYRVQSFS